MAKVFGFAEISRMANETEEVKVYNDLSLYQEKLGYVFKMERKRKGIGQTEMGKLIGDWSQPKVSAFENGNNVMLENYFLYANALGIDIAVAFSKARILVNAEIAAREENLSA